MTDDERTVRRGIARLAGCELLTRAIPHDIGNYVDYSSVSDGMCTVRCKRCQQTARVALTTGIGADFLTLHR